MAEVDLVKFLSNEFPCEIPLKWISMDPTDDKSTLVQLMAWCRQVSPEAEQILIIDPVFCCHMASLGHDELNP